jgi:hypothetical protein
MIVIIMMMIVMIEIGGGSVDDSIAINQVLTNTEVISRCMKYNGDQIKTHKHCKVVMIMIGGDDDNDDDVELQWRSRHTSTALVEQ